MAMVVKNNNSATNTLNTLNKNSSALSKSLQKVSSGMKINSAGDDASGYSISERMRVQMRGLEQDIANTQNGVSMMKVAEGGVASTVDILKTLKEKAINAANDTNTDLDRATIQKEVDQSIDQINDNASITFNGKRILDGSYVVPSLSIEAVITDALHSEWLPEALEQIEYAYGLSFKEDGTYTTDMDVNIDTSAGLSAKLGTTVPNNALAFVSASYYSDGSMSDLSLNINMDRYVNMFKDNVNGKNPGDTTGLNYLDRTIMHEMTHAAMSANIKGFDQLYLYVKEGAAELIHGADDRSYDDLTGFTAGSLNTALNDPATSAGGGALSSVPYAAGYVYFRYLAAQTGGSAVDTMRRYMRGLDETNQTGLAAMDGAVSFASKGRFSSHQELVDSIYNDFTAAGTADAFYKKYCNMDISNKDTGGILGWDASGTEVLNAEDTVTEGGSTKFWTHPIYDTTTIEGLHVHWPRSLTGEIGTQVLQVGTKANQVIKIDAFDMRAKAIGVQDEEGNAVSVRTRAAANRAISRFDKAVQRALDAQTTIGALQNRLEYTARNLTTASENVRGSESTIRDADMAKEMTDYTKHNVLTQAAQSMLAQANQNSSSVLSLLQ